MSGIFARVRDGKISPVRYTSKHLKFSNTLAAILSTGDIVIPLLSPVKNLTPEGKPTYRDPTFRELSNAIVDLDDLDTELYPWDLNVKAAALNADGDIDIEHLPNTVKTYKGLWNPETNMPNLKDGVGRKGEMYQVTDGFPEDYMVDLGSGPIKVRSGLRLEYRGERWVPTGYIHLSNYERSLLDRVMVRSKHNNYDGKWGSDAGAFDIISYPAILETLNGGVVVGQLSPVNCPRGAMVLHDNGGLDGLVYIPETGEIFLDAENVPPGTYRPSFIVGSSLNRSDPIEVRIDVLEYTLEPTTGEIIIPSGETYRETIISPQDPEPILHVLDPGELWNVKVSEDGKAVEINTFCCVEGTYYTDIVAKGPKGESEILTLEAKVELKEGQESPSWSKGTIDMGGHDSISDNRAMARLDIYPIDMMPLDYEVY